MLLNCGVGGNSWESFGLQEIQLVHPKGNHSWIFIGRTDTEAETPILWPPDVKHLKGPWCWERMKAGGEGDDKGWDGWMASPTQWIWVWVNSGSWWWTGRPGMPQFMGSQRIGHDWVNWTDMYIFVYINCIHFIHNVHVHYNYFSSNVAEINIKQYVFRICI